jgi:hypothetical protein
VCWKEEEEGIKKRACVSEGSTKKSEIQNEEDDVVLE